MRITVDVSDVERARSGGEALEHLLEAVWPEAFRMSLAILRNRELAEDAAQEACVAIARNLATLRNSSSFHAWACKVIANRAIGMARNGPRDIPLDTLAEWETAAERSDALDLHRALASLSPVQRAAVLLHYYAGLRSAEIAAAIGVSPATIRFRLMLARRNLRKALSAPRSPLPVIQVTSNVQ